MQFDTYKIQSPLLRKYVQYILFNFSARSDTNTLITSYANNNICLGIIKDYELSTNKDDEKYLKQRDGIHSYLSGIYLTPHRFRASGRFDEICIDFTPAGYYKFFKNPLKTNVLEEDVLKEAWGANAIFFFESVFDQASTQKRGSMIEQFLLRRLLPSQDVFLDAAVSVIHQCNGHIKLSALSKTLRCSEKKIERCFYARLDLSPKDYLKVLRFRQSLNLFKTNHLSLTDIAHQLNYYDQSHFNKDFKLFTGLTPGQVHRSLHNIKDDVMVSIQ